MTETRELDGVDDGHFDVVICGAGLAGLTLGLQLRQEHPGLRVLMLERTTRPLPDACHKVGESSVELGSQYLERLGLRAYLKEKHLFKHGLRFFPGGGHKPLHERLEIGPMQEPIVPSYQLDRGVLESDLRGMVEAKGVTLREGCVVRDIALETGEAPHGITFEDKATGTRHRVSARWVVDATGRNALLRRRMKLTRGARHTASAGWYRVEGKVDITTFVPEEVKSWHNSEYAPNRWRSTNHLMGSGYWAWIIPLSSGNTSIGVVVHEPEHSFDSVRTLERAQSFLAEHEPVLAKQLEAHKVLDFLCIHDYSNTIGRGWSGDRWALVGEAGAFVDPLYSPGTDFIAYANSFTCELIRADLAGEDLTTRARDLNLVYRALVSGNIDIYRDAAPVYNHARAMLAKVYWDNFAYWSYSCQYFLRGIFRLSGEEAASFVDVGVRFVELSQYMQKLFREWALVAPAEPQAGFAPMPRFPSVLVDAHLALQYDMTPEETLAYMRQRLTEGEEIAGEFLIRVLSEVGDEKAAELAERIDLKRFRLSIAEERLEVEPNVGLARRRALSPLARDVERNLGRAERLTSQAQLKALLAPVLTSTPKPAQTASA